MKDNKDKLENEHKDNKKRKIEFRGKRVDNGEWVYGLPMYMNYIKEFTEHEWIDELDNNRVKKYQTSAAFQIEGETLGQFTGLCDKNGKKIYEGDVVKFIDYDSYDEGFENAGVVKYGGNMFYVTNRYSLNMEDLVDDLEGSMYCEVISNIYDDPEMWEEYDEKPNN